MCVWLFIFSCVSRVPASYCLCVHQVSISVRHFCVCLVVQFFLCVQGTAVFVTSDRYITLLFWYVWLFMLISLYKLGNAVWWLSKCGHATPFCYPIVCHICSPLLCIFLLSSSGVLCLSVIGTVHFFSPFFCLLKICKLGEHFDMKCFAFRFP